MFDSNIFDKLPEIIQAIKQSSISQYEYYVSPVQIEELCEIPDSKIEIRKKNILMLADLRATLVPLSIFPLNGRARLGYARLGLGEVYEKILNDNKSNSDDAIIADTSVTENCTLVTADIGLYRRMTKNHYPCLMYDDFIHSITTTSESVAL